MRQVNVSPQYPHLTHAYYIFRGALESYAKSVSAEGITEYAPVYPVMLELLQKGLDG